MQMLNRLFSMTRLQYLVAAAVLMLMTFPLHATLINPGGVGTPDAFANPGAVSTIDHIHTTFNFGSGALTGSIDEYVLDDPFGAMCSNCLDFAFFLSVDSGSTASISTFGFANVTGYKTDVAYVTGTGGGTDPDFDNRLPSPGLAVGWGFTGLVGGGQSTDALLVVTNATKFDLTGFVSMNEDPESVTAGRPGGFIFSFDGPVAVPEPSTALLLGLGMAGIAAFLKKAR
jgi:PEP-CTERM motif